MRFLVESDLMIFTSILRVKLRKTNVSVFNIYTTVRYKRIYLKNSKKLQWSQWEKIYNLKQS